MYKRVAVMDLGTNTFHLLIAEGNSVHYEELHHDHVAVKLGERGINEGLIQPEAFKRGLETMKNFRAHIDKYEVTAVKAIGTSAMRSAANGNDFIKQVKAQTGINIEIIDGDSEAGYIYKGVRLSEILNKKCSLIVDIGGGSIEFIIANKNQIYWKQSFEIGAARLMDLFHKTDPIPADCIAALKHYLDETLVILYQEVNKYEIVNIIGSSGAFETFAEIIEREKGNDFDLNSIKKYFFNEDSLLLLFEKIIHSSHRERLSNPHIISVRVDMIVVASIVTKYLMEKLNIGQVIMSVYSLKEGVLAEMLA